MPVIDIERDTATPAPATPAPATRAPTRAEVSPRTAPATPLRPAADARAPRPPLISDLTGRLSGRWCLLLAGAWVLVMVVGSAVAPAPADPEALSAVDFAVNTGLLATWGVMAAGLLGRHRVGAAASLAGALVLVGMTVACPLSGHHGAVGAWFGVQLAGAAALVGLSRRALRAR